MRRSRSILAFLFFGLCLLLWPRSGSAAPCSPAHKPNNDLASAEPVAAEFCRSGQTSGDNRDLFRWTLSAGDANDFWSIGLEALPGQSGQIELFELIPGAQPKDIKGAPLRLRAAMAPGSNSVHMPPMLFRAGTYIIAVSGPHGAAMYRLRAQPAGALPPAASVPTAAQHDTFQIMTNAADHQIELPWHFSSSAAGQRWTFSLQTPPGTPVPFRLRDHRGTELVNSSSADAQGIERIADIGIPAGDYTLVIDSHPGVPIVVSAAAEGPHQADFAEEPDDDRDRPAHKLAPGATMRGRLIPRSGDDIDIYALDVPNNLNGHLLDLAVTTAGEGEVRLTLMSGQQAVMSSKSGSHDVRLSGLALDPGHYLVEVRGALPPDQEYSLSANDAGQRQSGVALEPNDTPETATHVVAGQNMTGNLSRNDQVDYLSFDVKSGLELWNIQITGDGVANVVLYDATHTVLGHADRSRGSAVLRLSRLLLAHGPHILRLEGDHGSWLLQAQDLGPPKPGDEIEPNDDVPHATTLTFGLTQRGWLDHAGDIDQYAFYLPAKHHVRVTLDAPAGFPVQADLGWGDQGDRLARFVTKTDSDGMERLVWDGLLPAGDYFLSLTARNLDSSLDPYTLKIDTASYFNLPTDLEPNDQPWQAREIPANWTIDGTSFPGDIDWFQLSPLNSDTTLKVEGRVLPADGLDVEVARRRVGGGPSDVDALGQFHLSGQNAAQQLKVPSATPILIRFQAWKGGAYQVVLSKAGQPVTAPAPTSIKADLSLDASTIAAFIAQAQDVAGTLHVHSDAAAAVTLKPTIWIGDERWSLRGLGNSISIGPRADMRLPVVLHVAPDAHDSLPIGVEVSLESGAAATAVAQSQVTAQIGATPVAAHREYAIPEAMRGGVNVAWSALGAKTEDPYARLIGGIVDATVTALPFGRPVTVQLAGGGAHQLVGAILTPPGKSAPTDRLKRFSIAASMDGATFTPLMEAEMSPLARPQAFAFTAPVKARYIRLTALDRQGDPGGDKALLNQLKIVADPSEPFIASGFDLGAPELGGHVVWITPQSRPAVNGEDAPWPGTQPVVFTPGPQTTAAWVFAFRAHRAALITELTWKQATPTDSSQQRIGTVEVSSSTAGPFGPWTAIGRWRIAPGSDGMARLKLAQPTWIRDLRIRVIQPSSGKLLLPQRMGAAEQQSGATYRSIVGEWGDESSEAGFEEQTSQSKAAAPPVPAHAAHSRDKAGALAPGAQASGVVKLGDSGEWYRIEVPNAARQLIFQLGGQPVPEAAIALEDRTGKLQSLVPDPDSPGKYSTPVQKGTYFLHVTQPRRSVIVAFDTSGSVTGFMKGIERVVDQLSHDMKPGEEEVNLLPFRSPDRDSPMLDQFSGEPGDVVAALAGYTWGDNSSNAEAALIGSVRALAKRPGLHAIAIITDAASDGADKNAMLWEQLSRLQPKIFSLKVPTTDAVKQVQEETNSMEDWSYSAGGFFTLFSSQGEADTDFRRMAARLRQPSIYAVSYTIDTTPPAPGQLIVKLAAPVSASGPAGNPQTTIEVVLDASGSMLQRIGGKRKIEIEKGLLADLTKQILPPGSPFALRVFGQGGRGSCRTDLVIPVAPLDARRVASLIDTVQSTNGAKTPIGESLRLVPQDLAQEKGKRQLVLITDGGEDCGGDPESEIQKLRAAGFDVRINIVGFAVDEPGSKTNLQKWAALGGGHYFDASDRPSLERALHQAFVPDFDVVAASGQVIAHGAANSTPLALPAGSYKLRLSSSSPSEIPDVQVSSGRTTTVEVTP